jgi:hypothetical protein
MNGTTRCNPCTARRSLRKTTKGVMRVPNPSPPLQVAGRLVPSGSEKAEGLADGLKAQFQLVNDPWDTAITVMVAEAMRACQPASPSRS